MRILAVGCTGFLGSALLRALGQRGDAVVVVAHSGRYTPEARQTVVAWDSPWELLLNEVHAVINLAGTPIAGRWTPERKQLILNSRLESTQRIRHALTQQQPKRPLQWINASAVGIYGNSGDIPLTEASSLGTGFLAEVCRQWEASAQISIAEIRCVHLRTGLVLGPEGGFLKPQLNLFRWGLGGPLGKGEQYIPWIHLQDWVRAVLYAMDNALEGPVNLVSPQALPQKEFARILGSVIHRPAFLPLPGWILRTLLGEASTLLLSGQNAKPAALLDHGFTFNFSDLQSALQNVLQSQPDKEQ